LNRLLASRREALAWLTGNPPQTATEDWQAQLARDNDQLARDNDRVARATKRVNALQAAARAWQTMTNLLADPANAALYRRRDAIIEPLFAQWFTRFGRAVAHNLDKISRARRRRTAPT
jgi:hypothetical protein